MGEQYRVVRADGTVWQHNLSLDEAQAEAARGNAWPDNHVGLPVWPYRVQQRVDEWVDVPVPEPLPDLPTEVWAYQWATNRANIDLGAQPPKRALPGSRVFRGRVVEWEEITEP